MHNRLELKQEDRTNYVSVMKLASVWQNLIWNATQDYRETTFPEEHFKTCVDNIVNIGSSEKGLDEKSREYVDVLYECLKVFRDQLTIMKAYLDTVPGGINSRIADLDVIAAGVCTNDNIRNLSKNERVWMRDFEYAVCELYHNDVDARERDGLNFRSTWLSVPASYQTLDNILAHAGGNTLANMIAKLDPDILELEDSGILSSHPSFLMK